MHTLTHRHTNTHTDKHTHTRAHTHKTARLVTMTTAGRSALVGAVTAVFAAVPPHSSRTTAAGAPELQPAAQNDFCRRLLATESGRNRPKNTHQQQHKRRHTTRVNGRRRRQSRFGRPDGHPKAVGNQLGWPGCPSCRPLSTAQPDSPAFFACRQPRPRNVSFRSAAANSAPATNDGGDEAACGLWPPFSPPARPTCRPGDRQQLSRPLAPRVGSGTSLSHPAATSTRARSQRSRTRANKSTVRNGFKPLQHLYGQL